jgi:thymidine kinase
MGTASPHAAVVRTGAGTSFSYFCQSARVVAVILSCMEADEVEFFQGRIYDEDDFVSDEALVVPGKLAVDVRGKLFLFGMVESLSIAEQGEDVRLDSAEYTCAHLDWSDCHGR